MARQAENYRARRNDAWQRREANAAYASITTARPENTLPPAIRKEIATYARQHLGSARYAPWLEVYAAWRGEFVEGCIPDNYHGRYVVPHSVGNFRAVLGTTLSRSILQTDRLPDVGYAFRGRLYDLQGAPMTVAELAKRTLGDHPFLYLKHASSQRGLGVVRITGETLADSIAQSDEAVLQTPIPIHPDLEAVFPNAAATLRITTVHNDGEVRAVAAYCRFGSGNDMHLKSKSHIRVGVDLSSGRYCSEGALPDWTPISSHPDTGFSFAGHVYPGFSDAVQMCVAHHARIRMIRYVGWDVAMTPSEKPMLFEANAGHSDIKFSEACHGPIFAGLGWDRLHVKAAAEG